MGKFQGKMTWIVTLLAQMRKKKKNKKLPQKPHKALKTKAITFRIKMSCNILLLDLP